MLERTADGHVGKSDGDGVKGVGVKFRVPLYDVEGALGGEGVIVAMDTMDDFAFFSVRVGGDSEVRMFNGGMDRFGCWCPRQWVD